MTLLSALVYMELFTLIMSPSHELATAACQNSSTVSRPSSLSQLWTRLNLAASFRSGVYGGNLVRSSARRSRKGF